MNAMAAARTVVIGMAMVVAGCGSDIIAPSSASVGGASPSAATPAPGTSQPNPSATPNATPTPAAQPTPGVTPSPSATASPPPAAGPQVYQASGEIGDTLFTPDGRIIVVEQDWAAQQSRVVALDESGTPLDGWPWSAGPTGSPIADAVAGPDGSVYVIVRGEAGDPIEWSWSLHRLSTAGTEMEGFPVTLPDVPFCELHAGPHGSAYVNCEVEDDATGRTTGEVRVVRPDGVTSDGWPVATAGSTAVVGFRPDGSVALMVDGSSITVLRPDGTTARGWPRRIKGPKWSTAATVDARGWIRMTSRRYQEGQCGAAISTTYTLLRLGGSVVPGWPVTLRGWASDPALADDGTMVVVTGAGKAIRYSDRGQILAGWPVSNVPVRVACYGGSQPVDAGAHGFVVTGAGKVTRLTRGGRIATGSPATAPFRLATSCEACTPGPAGPLAPAVGTHGVFVGAYRGQRPRIIGVTWDGSLPDSWQAALGRNGDEIWWVRVAPDGQVWAALARWDDASEVSIGLLVPVVRDAAPQG